MEMISTNERNATRVDELTACLRRYNEAYYVQDAPEVEDFVYDAIRRELEAIEATWPTLARADSPTQVVGGRADARFDAVGHAVPMLSLQDFIEKSALEKFVCEIEKDIPGAAFSVEPKIDGLSVSLEYEDGKFVRGLTRGGGLAGENVTANLLHVKGFPRELPGGSPRFLEVRGEVYMPPDVFDALNRGREDDGRLPFKNLRGAAAGSLRQKNPKITAERGLRVCVFDILRSNREFARHDDAIRFLANFGFSVIPQETAYAFSDVWDAILRIEENAARFDYTIDGAVVKLNNLQERERLGATKKFPRWAAAFRYPPCSPIYFLR